MGRIKSLVLAAIGAALLGLPSLAAVAPIAIPPGLNPGDQYRLAFVTSTTRDATSGNIAVYNEFVTASATAQAELNALGTTWTAIASTGDVDARVVAIYRAGNSITPEGDTVIEHAKERGDTLLLWCWANNTFSTIVPSTSSQPRCMALLPHQDGRLRVSFENGATAACDVLVGADGIWAVRVAEESSPSIVFFDEWTTASPAVQAAATRPHTNVCTMYTV